MSQKVPKSGEHPKRLPGFVWGLKVAKRNQWAISLAGSEAERVGHLVFNGFGT